LVLGRVGYDREIVRYFLRLLALPLQFSYHGSALTGTYVVCLDCAKELPYDWQEMRIVTSPDEYSGGVRSLATKEAA